jgi:hypothetical protein
MADFVSITPGSGADIATDEIAGLKHQRVKISVGADGSATDLAFGQALSGASLPVVIASDQSAISVSGPATDAQLRATPLPISGTVTANAGTGTMAVSAASLPLPAGAATEASLSAILADVDRLPVLVSGRTPVDGSAVTQPVSIAATVSVSGPVTDAQIRATPLPVSGTVTANAGTGTMAISAASLPLPTDAATETTLAAINTKIPSVGQADMASSQPVVIASNQSAVPVTLPSMVLSSYSQAGVIVINTDLLLLDCLGFQAVSIQCTSMGTTGVVTCAFSNNNSTFVNTSIMTQAGTAAATFNSAGLWTTPVIGRYLRLRLTTATTAGTTTLAVYGLSSAASIPVVAQPVSGSVSVSGSLTSAGTTTNTPVTPTTTFTNSAATNNAAFLKASAGTVWSISAFNAGASPVYVKYYNRTTAPAVGTDVPVMVVSVPATDTVMIGGGANGIRFATGIAIAIVTGAADTDNTAVAAAQVKVATSWT